MCSLDLAFLEAKPELRIQVHVIHWGRILRRRRIRETDKGRGSCWIRTWCPLESSLGLTHAGFWSTTEPCPSGSLPFYPISSSQAMWCFLRVWEEGKALVALGATCNLSLGAWGVGREAVRCYQLIHRAFGDRCICLVKGTRAGH